MAACPKEGFKCLLYIDLNPPLLSNLHPLARQFCPLKPIPSTPTHLFGDLEILVFPA